MLPLTHNDSNAAAEAAKFLGAKSWIVTQKLRELADPTEPQWGYITRLCLLLDGERIQWGSMCEGDLLLDDID